MQKRYEEYAPKIFRGDSAYISKPTHEYTYKGEKDLLPGTVVVLDEQDGIKPSSVDKDTYFYILGEKLGFNSHYPIQTGETARLYKIESGDLYHVRATSSVELKDDAPLSVNNLGQVTTPSQGEDGQAGSAVVMFVDNRPCVYPEPEEVEEDGDFIPVKFK